ncbi:bzip transcription factor [Grosmannia clavigera kw1407]|uniref:Bzip transcription factor n=1 Tax=Grosmannia clavigera (strain kw1407 / UAMH 11150) TaxID=655863 RepID=F0XA68_GROCL|nr:bzip transcription factor [Grosmannia clavigera kw1407]EFX05278.1 bzip transcription factor [Grosmannia clavigera kw1407]
MAFGRRGPNISQFLRELHENPSVLEDSFPTVDDQDLSMFTNTEFYDLETGQNTDFQPQPSQPSKVTTDGGSPSDAVTPVSEETAAAITDFNSLDFIATGDFNFPDFGAAYPSPSIPSYPDNLGSLQPIQPGPQHGYQSSSPTGQSSGHHNSYGSSHQPPRIAAADKRKPDVLNHSTRAMSFEEQTRLAAEEDKRRRNTAASARFRVKKKQREQALEKSAKEMTDKVTALENRISQLETENKWLKGIVLEKNAGNEEFLGKLLEDFKAKHAKKANRRGDAGSDTSSSGITDEENEARDSSG